MCVSKLNAVHKCSSQSKISTPDWNENSPTERLASVMLVSLGGESWGTLYQCRAAFWSPAPAPPHLWFLSWAFVWRNVGRTNADRDKHRGMVRGWRPHRWTSTIPINPDSILHCEMVGVVEYGAEIVASHWSEKNITVTRGSCAFRKTMETCGIWFQDFTGLVKDYGKKRDYEKMVLLVHSSIWSSVIQFANRFSVQMPEMVFEPRRFRTPYTMVLTALTDVHLLYFFFLQSNKQKRLLMESR